MTSQKTDNQSNRATRWGVLALVGLMLGGCGTELPQGIQILGNVVPSDECLVKTQGGGQQELRPFGVMDLAVGSSYTGFFMISNQFPQFEGITGFQPEDARLDGSVVSLSKVKVTLELPVEVIGFSQDAINTEAQALGWTSAPFTLGAQVASASYERPMGGTFGPQEAAVAITDVIPSNIGRLLRVLTLFTDDTNAPSANEIQATLKLTAHGKRADGKKVSSTTFVFPVTICYRCLIADVYPDDVALNPYGDEESPLTGAQIIGNACAIGTDVPVTNALCGALYGPSEVTSDPCKLARCFGQPHSEMGDALKCDNDGVTADLGVAE